ncbi:MAG: hypothetical protein HYV09_36225 [Deltaproteobacteria bacterium]|nr:hypothetical protein [Deltaproteobacteria bacterium]
MLPGRIRRTSVRRASWRLLVAASTLFVIGCREAPTVIRRDDHIEAARSPVDSSAPHVLVDAAGEAAPPNERLDCRQWIGIERNPKPPRFPHRITPPRAVDIAFAWMHRHGIDAGIIEDEVGCPNERCIEPDDCWFSIMLVDPTTSATSINLFRIFIHAQTGDVKRLGTLADGGYGDLIEHIDAGR